MARESKALSIIEVIPIVKGLTKPTLSYFTKENFEIGNFVTIPIRSGRAQGIVVSIKDAKDAKNEIRSATFALKKISKSNTKISLSDEFIKAAELTANFYATTVGSILGALLPKIILEDPSLIASSIKKKNTPLKGEETLLVQMDDQNRFREYKSIVRECFSKKCSVLICVPTHEDGLRIFDYLSRGIEKYAYLTSNKSPKELKKIIQKATNDPHPILFVTTYSYLAINRIDFNTIILERENSRSYRTFSRPYIHIKTFLEYFAKVSKSRLILGDSVLSIETLWKEKQGEYTDLSPLQWRIDREAQISLIDMKKIKNENSWDNQNVFEVFSPELKSLIGRSIEEKNKIFLFGVRKGLAPSTVCGDCGNILACLNCGAPVVLHEQGPTKERIYICHACGANRTAHTHCDNCNSWKLIPLGIGIDRIKNEIETLYPGTPIFVMDKDNAPTPARARKIAQEFASIKGGILVGTELAFLYLEKIPYSGIVSLDSLFSIPDFGINERIFYLASKLSEMTTKETIFQTRNIGKSVLTYATEGNILDFYRSEIEDRESLLYPPYSIFIKVTTTGSPSEIEAKAMELRKLFIEYTPDFIRFKSTNPGLFTLSMVIRVPRIHWPDQSLREKLLLLTPDFLIKVDPESIL